MKLGVLDQSPLRSGATPAQALEETVALARHADALGFSRYWLAEHHGSRGLMGPAPELLIARIAAVTERIRVGSGGVMLMHYSPFKVAEQFRVLETLFPGRIDLGVGRAPGSDQPTAAALSYGNRVGIEYFAAKVADLGAFVSGEPSHTEALRDVQVSPPGEGVPELWLLGSTDQSVQLAAHLGWGFSHAHFIAPEHTEAIVRLYRERFQPSTQGSEPRVSLGVFVLCADSEEEALELGLCRDLWRQRMRSGGDPGPWPTVAEAHAELGGRLASDSETGGHQILGTPEQVAERLEALAGRCDVDELMVISITPEFEQRLRCYELLSGIFDLASQTSTGFSKSISSI